jgi:hypothetical protein
MTLPMKLSVAPSNWLVSRLFAGLAVLILVCALGACGGSSKDHESKAKDPTASTQATDPLSRAAFGGKVTSIEPEIYYSPEVQIDGNEYTLASVQTLSVDSYCEGPVNPAQVNAPLLAMLRRLLPLGTRVIAFKDSADEVYVHRADREAVGPSINELLVRSGWGRPVIFDQKKHQVSHEVALAYQNTMVGAWKRARSAKAGGYGVCAAEKKRWDRQQAQFEHELRAGASGKRSGPVTISGSGSVSLDWGDGYCDSCRWALRILRWIF